MKESNNDNEKRIWSIFIFFIIILIFILFISWIIYYFVSDKKSNNEIIDNNFLKSTNSYLYYENYYSKTSEYEILNYKYNDKIFEIGQDEVNTFHPYYEENGKIAFTWFKEDEYGLNLYNLEYFDDFEKSDLDQQNPNAELIKTNPSINHEYIYKSDFGDHYYFMIDNLNGWQGKDSNDNGGLGYLSVQQIDIVKESTNQQKIIDITDLLNYSENYWYYIDQKSGEYYRTIMPSNDFFHFNSIDYYQQNIYVNSRTMGTIFSIKVLDENGNILDNPEINWIYSGNYDTYYYLYENDLDGDHSIIYDQESGKYVANPNYDPQKTYDYYKNNGGLQDKFINWEIDGNYYSTDDLESLREIQNKEKDQLFMGEHCVKLLNPYIEKLGAENFFLDPNSYDLNDLYFSMFDNHAEWNNTNLDIQESFYNEKWYQTDPNSYIKIIEINPNDFTSNTNLAPMTGRVILNHPTEQKSPNISSTLFFNENGNNYVAVDQGNGTSNFADNALLTIYQFDKVDTTQQDFNQAKIVYQLNFEDEKSIFRAYPIWEELNDNVIVSWNG